MSTPSDPSRGLHALLRSLRNFCCVVALAALAGCGGGGSDGSPAPATGASAGPQPGAANVLPVVLDRGFDGSGPFNIPYVTVVVCQPGTQTCQSVDHVVVDTASYGLRIAASALGSALPLPPVVSPSGAAIGDCGQFVSGFAWGSVHTADVQLAGEKASGIPIQLVNNPAAAFATIPASCAGTGANIGVGRGAKGILGVGFLPRDCGTPCANSTAAGVYFACQAGGCVATTVPVASQVANPVAFLAADNNGVALELPPVAAGGAATLAGTLTFGIDTQSNNQLGNAVVLQANSLGNFTTRYKGASYSSSFIDSGSNAIFFTDASLPTCSAFYCPPAALTLSAVNSGANGISSTVTFTVESIANVPSSIAAINAGGPIGVGRSFDWGLPFFFGRKVFVALTGATTSRGTGPFWAW